MRMEDIHLISTYISERRIFMPNYRNADDEYCRKPKKCYEREYEPEDDNEEEDKNDDRKCEKKPFFCKLECPFKIIVKVVPCEDKKHRDYLE
jgi:hypothetical protein